MFLVLLCLFFSMTSASKFHLGAQLGDTDLSSQLNAGANHSNVIGFHVIVSLPGGVVGTSIKFEDCGADCSTQNTLIKYIPDISTEPKGAFDWSDFQFSNIKLYQIKYKSGQEHTHIKATIRPNDCQSPACEIVEESYLCPLGEEPTPSGGCQACSSGTFQSGVTCSACSTGVTAAKESISCDVKTNQAATFAQMTDAVQKNVQQMVRRMQATQTITSVENEFSNMITEAKTLTVYGQRIILMGNIMATLFSNLPQTVQPNDIQMSVGFDDATLTSSIKTDIQTNYPYLATLNVRWAGAKPGVHTTCDLDANDYQGVAEVLMSEAIAPMAILCRGTQKIVRVKVTGYVASTGVESVTTECWTGSGWDTPVNRVKGDLYTCNGEYLFINSAGIVNPGCTNIDVSAPNINSVSKCDCGSDQCDWSVPSGNGPYCEASSSTCLWSCIAEYVPLKTARGHVRVDELKVGDSLETADGELTKITDIRVDSVPRNALHEVECDGASAHLTDNHVYQCAGKWHHPNVRNKRRLAESDKPVDVYSILTENYCQDNLVTASGLIIESWDGREPDAMRPHRYEEGRRLDCRPFTDQDKKRTVIMKTWSNNM